MDETPWIAPKGRATQPGTGALVCVRCGSGGLEATAGHLDCPQCGTMYPLLAGVPVMFADAVPVTVPRVDEATARGVLEAFGLDVDPVSVLRLRRASGRGVRLGAELAETEGAQFLDRVRATGHPLPPAGAPDLAQGEPAASVGAEGAAPGDVPRYRWLKDYVPRRLPPGYRLTCNLRFENTGRVVIRHAGRGHVTLVYRWLDADGQPVEHTDERTPLPVDVEPGRQLTAPIRLTAPSAPGRYRLRLLMIEEGVRVLDRDASTFAVRIAEGPAPSIPPGWALRDEAPESYQADHARAAELLGAWARERAPARPRVLEIGGNANPMIAELPGDLYNIDVDLLGLQVCRMVERSRGRATRDGHGANAGSLQPVCADADRLPFPRGYFDVIVIAASLHHFPDPAATLAGIRDRLSPSGFIALLCEPVGHIWPGAVEPAFLAELAKGVNEQSFLPAEYDMMFREAGLTAEEAVIDHNSLKARLVPAAPVAA